VPAVLSFLVFAMGLSGNEAFFLPAVAVVGGLSLPLGFGFCKKTISRKRTTALSLREITILGVCLHFFE